MDMTAPIAVRCALPDLQVICSIPSHALLRPETLAGLVHTKG